MINYSDTKIENITSHQIVLSEDNILLNSNEYKINDEIEEEILHKIFLKPFSSNLLTYEFSHPVDNNLNPLFKLSEAIHGGESFLDNSYSIAKHLKAVSKHPSIKDGDLFLVKFDEILYDGIYCEALGIYKVETKDSFIETNANETGNFNLTFRQGLRAKKLDKACLILFTPEAYTILVIDTVSNQADYWLNDFIGTKSKDDYVNNTNEYLNLAKSFILEQIPTEYEVSKPDQIDFLNKTVDYFKKNQAFNKHEFEHEVFADADVITSFNQYNSNYSNQHDVDIADSFDISKQVVKKQARAFKSILKLDRNFHIYIHGNRNLIEKGIDDDGRKFYKVYYDVEH